MRLAWRLTIPGGAANMRRAREPATSPSERGPALRNDLRRCPTLVLWFALLNTPVLAQVGVWTQVAPSGPGVRWGHAMAYDSQRGRTVLFGGNPSSGLPLGDTWEWNGSAWTQVSITGPSGRAGHAMAYDSQRGRTVLFGGSGYPETWEWDGSGSLPPLLRAPDRPAAAATRWPTTTSVGEQ
jgi:hypothetical protein